MEKCIRKYISNKLNFKEERNQEIMVLLCTLQSTNSQAKMSMVDLYSLSENF